MAAGGARRGWRRVAARCRLLDQPTAQSGCGAFVRCDCVRAGGRMRPGNVVAVTQCGPSVGGTPLAEGPPSHARICSGRYSSNALYGVLDADSALPVFLLNYWLQAFGLRLGEWFGFRFCFSGNLESAVWGLRRSNRNRRGSPSFNRFRYSLHPSTALLLALALSLRGHFRQASSILDITVTNQ